MTQQARKAAKRLAAQAQRQADTAQPPATYLASHASRNLDVTKEAREITDMVAGTIDVIEEAILRSLAPATDTQRSLDATAVGTSTLHRGYADLATPRTEEHPLSGSNVNATLVKRVKKFQRICAASMQRWYESGRSQGTSLYDFDRHNTDVLNGFFAARDPGTTKSATHHGRVTLQGCGAGWIRPNAPNSSPPAAEQWW